MAWIEARAKARVDRVAMKILVLVASIPGEKPRKCIVKILAKDSRTKKNSVGSIRAASRPRARRRNFFSRIRFFECSSEARFLDAGRARVSWQR